MTTKKKKKPNKKSLANLVPGGNIRSGAYLYRRTGRIPPEHSDLVAEAKRLRKELQETYCRPGDPVLEVLQPRIINQLVSDSTFSEILWRHLWSWAARAGGGDKLQECLTSSGWMALFAADNKVGKAFRHLERNLKDFA